MKLWISLTIIGVAGVFTLLLSPSIMDSLSSEMIDQFHPDTLRYLVLINPIILTLVFNLVGVKTFRESGYSLVIFEPLISNEPFDSKKILSSIVNALIFGIIAGVIVQVFTLLMSEFIPQYLINGVDLNLITKIGYGGVTEELMMRFGLMSLITFLLIKLIKNKSDKIHWISICVAALLFGLGHLPYAFELSDGALNIETVIYVIAGNFIPGVIFGLLYWKNSLESAMLGHIVFHLVTF